MSHCPPAIVIASARSQLNRLSAPEDRHERICMAETLSRKRRRSSGLSLAFSPAVASIAIGLLSVPQIASALTMQQANENCRQTVGRPIVQACMGGQAGPTPRREHAAPRRRRRCAPACMAALNKANGRANVAVVDRRRQDEEGSRQSRQRPAGRLRARRRARSPTSPRFSTTRSPIRRRSRSSRTKPTTNRRRSCRSPIWPNSTTTAAMHAFAAWPQRGRDRRRREGARHRRQGRRSDAEAADPSSSSALQKQAAGDLKGAVAMFQQMIRETQNVRGMGGWIFNCQPEHHAGADPERRHSAGRGLSAAHAGHIVEVRTSGIPQKREAYIAARPRLGGRLRERRGRRCSKRAVSIARRRRPTRRQPTTSAPRFPDLKQDRISAPEIAGPSDGGFRSC